MQNIRPHLVDHAHNLESKVETESELVVKGYPDCHGMMHGGTSMLFGEIVLLCVHVDRDNFKLILPVQMAEQLLKSVGIAAD